jgi:hypothetical protein
MTGAPLFIGGEIFLGLSQIAFIGAWVANIGDLARLGRR